MNRIIIFGAPGSGKGTISKMLIRDFDLKHIAAGDLLRQLLMNDQPKYQKMRDIVNQGKLIPDSQITEMIKEQIELSEKEQKSILLDGFPRNINQAKLLAEICDVSLALKIDVPFKVIIGRLADRYLHEPSGRIYNLKWSPPKNPGVDDVTGEPLTKRADDTEEVIAKRLTIYEHVSAPLFDFYKEKGVLKTFQGEESKIIYKSIYPFIKSFLNKK